jgi:hypothetical protein
VKLGFRGRAFDVAAVGETFSTMDGNHFGQMAGSSMATAYVSGLASLLHARARPDFLRGADVKARILASVDFSSVLDKVVRFGVVNFSRALNFERDVVVVRSRSGVSTPPGIVARTGHVRITEGVLDGIEVKGQSGLLIPRSRIRRISAVPTAAPGGPYYSVVYISKDDYGQRHIRRVAHAKFSEHDFLRFTEGDDIFYLHEASAGQSPRPLLVDYTACSFVPGCLDDD